jgi:hypothetical protein
MLLSSINGQSITYPGGSTYWSQETGKMFRNVGVFTEYYVLHTVGVVTTGMRYLPGCP